MDILSYDEMRNITREFYNSIGVDYPTKLEAEAVASLTMPSYANEFSQGKGNMRIHDNNALATLGDAVCSAFLLNDAFLLWKSQEQLTKLKDSVTNKNLNKAGRFLLIEKLFERNNDLLPQNKKAYATAFEAVIGFTYLVNCELSELLFLGTLKELQLSEQRRNHKTHSGFYKRKTKRIKETTHGF